MSWENNKAIQNFREYLKIPSVHPDVNYDYCVTFLKKMSTELGLPFKVISPVAKKPIVIMTWEGTDPSLPSILLNSHMDVVPVFPDSWTYPPFSAHMTKDGKIYGRGAQDMKCVSIQYIETVRRMKERNIKLLRTVHMCFVSDEEIGGFEGMKKFVETDEFKNLNIGFGLDEGMASPENEYLVYNGERTCSGTPGHGSLLLDNTAGEKVRVMVDRFMDYRAKEKKKLEANSEMTIGDVTTVNYTRHFGGIQTNVVPESLTVVFDVRLAVDVDHDAFEQMILGWCDEAGEGTTIEFKRKSPKIEVTKLDDKNLFWVAFKEAADKMQMKLSTRIFPGGTDSKYLRAAGIPAIGFSPMARTPVLLHDHDEYLHADTFLKGIDIYEKLIEAVANVQ